MRSRFLNHRFYSQRQTFGKQKTATMRKGHYAGIERRLCFVIRVRSKKNAFISLTASFINTGKGGEVPCFDRQGVVR